MGENVDDNGVQDDYMDSDEDNEVSASKELPAAAYPFKIKHFCVVQVMCMMFLYIGFTS